MNKHFHFSGSTFRRLEELGVSASAVLRHAGLPHQYVDHARVLLKTEELFALWRAVGEVSTTVEVTGQTVHIATDSSSRSSTIDSRQIEDTPTRGRNPLSLIMTLPGSGSPFHVSTTFVRNPTHPVSVRPTMNTSHSTLPATNTFGGASLPASATSASPSFAGSPVCAPS